MDTEKVKQKIEETWGDESDFDLEGLEFVAYVIFQDLRDMEEDDWDKEESVEELQDIIINATRALMELEREPFEGVLERLDNHKEKDVSELSKKKVEEFRESDFPEELRDEE